MTKLIRRSLLWCVVFFLFWLGGLLLFAFTIPEKAPPPPTSDAIVVLTGGKNRLEHGLSLLAEGKSTRLFISGVHEDISKDQLLKLAPEGIQEKLSALDAEAIVIGKEAWNTIGNAEETLTWVRLNKVKSLLLVTSNYHMPRSLYEFRHLVKGVEIIPAPVPVDDFDRLMWWASPHYRLLVLSEYHKYLASKIRNALVRSLKEPS